MIDRKKIANTLRLLSKEIKTIEPHYKSVRPLSETVLSLADELDPQSEPFLADAKVGDLCQRRDGKWVQIDAIRNNGNKWSMYEAEGHSYYESGNSVCSELYHTTLDIIATEPLAPEGTAEWAWQMMLLGKKVTHIGLAESRAYYCADDIKQMLVEPNGEETPFDWDRDRWCKCNYQTGWQLYEPKPRPQYKVGDWVEYRVDSQIYYGEISDIRGYAYYLSVTTEDIPPDHRLNTRTARAIRFENIVRKLNPSEVIVKIGCLEGTVARYSSTHFKLIHQEGFIIIRFSAIDSETAELVKALLKAQGGNK